MSRLDVGRRICHSSVQAYRNVRLRGKLLLQRFVVATFALMLAFGTGLGQQAGGFVGEWQGTVDGIGEAKIVITGVRPDGRVEGRMEFALQSFVATFADKSHSTQRTSLGVVSGNELTLTIEAALGGTYRLALSGDRLAGSYTRGNSPARLRSTGSDNTRIKCASSSRWIGKKFIEV